MSVSMTMLSAEPPTASMALDQSPLDAVRGHIFNVQRYSIHDGPGIRTTVFLKGCPLRCLWCQNPESQHARPDVIVANGRSETIGRTVTVADVFAEVSKDAIFYVRSGGGVTLSGGEPLAQPRFSEAILRSCKAAGMHTALDTSLHAPWAVLRSLLGSVDLVLLDLKHLDPERHREMTGRSNELILENARRICHETKTAVRVRLPVIPGCNDSVENVNATAGFVARELGRSIPVHLLPYHHLGEGKYEGLGRPYALAGIEPPSEARMAELRGIVESYGLTAVIGG